MYRLVTLAVLVTLAFVAVACAGAPSAPALTLGAAPWADGEKAAKIKTTVRVVGQETVRVPAGSVDTWHVEAVLGQAKHNIWYAVAAPHTMVQYDNGTTMTVLAK